MPMPPLLSYPGIPLVLKTMKRYQFEIYQNQKIFQKFSNFKRHYFLSFWCYNSDQVVKNHLRDQENRLARIRRPRARLRARCTPTYVKRNMMNFPLFSSMAGRRRGFRARNRARAFLVRANRFF